MANILHRTINKTRDTLLRDVVASINQLNTKIDRLDQSIDGTKRYLHQTQLTVNHDQSLLLDEIRKWVKNSGIIHLSEAEILVKIFNGLKIYLDPRDVAVVPHLALDAIWEHRVTAAWLKVVKSNDVVIDIGANFGYFGALAAQLTDKKKSKVVFFEANPRLIPYIKKTLAVNWLNEQSVLENLAISDKAGTVTLNLLKDCIGSSSIQTTKQLGRYMKEKMYLETQEKIKVTSVSLDNYCKTHGIQYVDLIKMDIEGHEEIAYKGMRNIIKSSPNVTLFVEFTKDGYENPKTFYDQMLKDFGYVYVITDDGYITAPKKNDFATVIGNADDWVMPIFSKNAKLANR